MTIGTRSARTRHPKSRPLDRSKQVRGGRQRSGSAQVQQWQRLPVFDVSHKAGTRSCGIRVRHSWKAGMRAGGGTIDALLYQLGSGPNSLCDKGVSVLVAEWCPRIEELHV